MLRKLILILTLFISAAIAIWAVIAYSDHQKPAVYGDLDERFSKEYISYQGLNYRPRTGLSTFLMMGVDQTEQEEYNGPYRSGGQADFLQLIIIDSPSKAVRRIQIDRDTMAEITVLGVLGNELGTNTHQICLSHGFGDGKEQSCQYTADAVSRLLCGIEIDGYYAMNMNGISAFNELLGGVTVRVEDDFSQYDPIMIPGAVVTLHGDQTELFVRSRMSIGDGTNASRMRRQHQYMNSALSLAADRIKQDDEFLVQLLDGLTPYTVTNIARGRMINEGNKALQYTMEEMISLPGEHTTGEDGFIEFHVDQEALMQLVLQLFYEPVNL